MNRLQKKCYIAAIGLHLLLVLVLLVGPAFLSHKTEDAQVIDFIPANLIDGNFSGGGPKNPAPAATPAPPTPPVAQVTPQPPQPKPADVPKPTPTPVAKDEPKVVQKSKPDPNSLEVKPVKVKPTVSTKLVTRKPSTVQPTKSTQDDADAAAAQKRANDIAKSVRSLRSGLSSTTTIETAPGFGGGGEAYANYGTVVKSVYDAAWVEPTDAASDASVAKVTVVIANDGTVICARITEPSGDAQLDASVQRTLDRVKYVAPFPQGTSDKQRSFILNFNLAAKRLSA